MRETGRLFRYDQFVVFRGTLSGAFGTLSQFREGKDVLLPESVYVRHKAAFAAYGKRVAEVRCGPDGLMDLDALESAIRASRGGIAFVYFNSTYGTIPSGDYFGRLTGITEGNGILLAYDADVVFTVHGSGARHCLPPVEIGELKNLLVLGNLTKEFGCPGLRISYGITNQALASEIRRFQRRTMEMVPEMNRILAAAVVDRAPLSRVRASLRKRMALLADGMGGLGWEAAIPGTGICMFIDAPPSFARSRVASGGDLFYFYLLSELGILTRPGGTHSPGDSGRVRLVISETEGKIREALGRMRDEGVRYSMRMPAGLERKYVAFYRRQALLEERLTEAAAETDRLLGIYDSYRRLEAELVRLEGNESAPASRRREELGEMLGALSDSIRFASPLVWMMFKDKRGLLAQREDERISDFGDFKRHAGHGGSACGARMRFLNGRLRGKGIDLFDRKAFPDRLHLHEIYSQRGILETATEPNVVREWRRHEFHTERGKAAKWRDFPSKPGSHRN
jgi:aspartate/methionine/tyrosine aminotransferase